jgi:hypothetical protein
MKRGFPILLGLFLFATLAEAVMVKGIGYPPIRAETPAQAYLMAKRAAILDAYRNALNLKNDQMGDVEFYTGLAGFIKGARIVKVKPLSDGAVEVTIDVDLKDVVAVKKGLSNNRASVEDKPYEVSIQHWQNIISRYVKFN